MEDRVQRLLAGIDIDREIGLEIGPLASPLVPRISGRPIYYADYAPRAVLQEHSRHDPNVDIDAIPEIDFVIQPLPADLGPKFDYIVASHVAEHVPDLVGWITTLFGWLKPNGRVVLAIPDKRHCFDVLRSNSTSGQVIEAFKDRRPRPTFGTIYDAMRLAVHYDTARSWVEHIPPETLVPIFAPETAFWSAEESQRTGNYQDCHCWVFTYETFMEIIADLNRRGVAAIHVVRSSEPVPGSNEFHVVLAPAGLSDPA
jgi:SAM-dependent methyltransferase